LISATFAKLTKKDKVLKKKGQKTLKRRVKMGDVLLDYAFTVTTKEPLATKTATYTKNVLAIVKSRADRIGDITPCRTKADVKNLTDDEGVLELFNSGMRSIFVLPIGSNSSNSGSGGSSPSTSPSAAELRKEAKKAQDEVYAIKENVKAKRKELEEIEESVKTSRGEHDRLIEVAEEAKEAAQKAKEVAEESQETEKDTEVTKENAEKVQKVQKTEKDAEGTKENAEKAEEKAKKAKEEAETFNISVKTIEEKVGKHQEEIAKLEADAKALEAKAKKLRSPLSEFETTINKLIESSKHKFFTILISSDLSERFESFNFGTFKGVVGCSFKDVAKAKSFAVSSKRCGFYSKDGNRAKNMFYAFGKLLSSPTWQNQQYAEMSCDDDINDMGKARDMSDDRVSFVLTSEEYGKRLAFFVAGGHAITSPYICEDLKYNTQQKAVDYIQSNNPNYTLAQASLLEAALQSYIERAYVATNLITSASVNIELIKDNFRASGIITVPQPKALWGVDVELRQI
jgi:chemotaxis protein histidine kinase CheA